MKALSKNATNPAANNARIELLKYSVACPICGAIGMHYRLNPRLFCFDSQDLDLQPRQFRHLPGFEHLHPPCYSVWHCPVCLFAAGYKYFRDPLKDMLMPLASVRQHLRETAHSNAVYRNIVSLLGADIDEQKPTFLQAIKLNLLAIRVFDEMLTLLKQHYAIQARYYLQLGWLFRDLGERPEEQRREAPALAHLMRQLHVYWPAAPETEAGALRMALDFYALALEDTSSVRTTVDQATIRQQIGRVLCKLGEFQQAREILLDSIQRAQEARAGLERDLRLPRSPDELLTPEQSGEMVSQSRQLETLIAGAEALIENVYDQSAAAQTAQARSLLAGMRGKAPEEIRAVLRRNNIDARIIARVLPRTVKRGLFGFLSR